MQIGHVLALQLAGRMASRVRRQARCAAQKARQPRQMAVARERIVGQAQRANARLAGERVTRQSGQIVVVERAGRRREMDKGTLKLVWYLGIL